VGGLSPELETASRRRSPLGVGSAALLLACAAGAWVITLVQLRGMSSMSEDLGAFLVTWALMMTAMMLPSVLPVARAYLRTLRSRTTGAERLARTVALAAGYLLVWSAFGFFGYAAWRGVGALADARSGSAAKVAAGVLIGVGVYQFTPWKGACLSRCRAPFSFLLSFSSMQGRFKEVRIGIRHGLFCVGCCVGLMVVLILAGAMNLGVMAAIATVVLIEKNWRHGRAFSYALGVGIIGFALLVPTHPEWVPAIDQTTVMGSTDGM
jgi:predicted metal-binding membrane protein